MNTLILCKVGLHKKRMRQVFTPSIHAHIVTEVDFSVYCERCGSLLEEVRWKWDEKRQEMVDISKGAA